MDDLISRQAAIEAVKIPDNGCLNASERHGIIFARVEARRAIQDIPSVPAVPLDELCEWLAEYLIIPCTLCPSLENDYCAASGPCLSSAEDWREAITKWMNEKEG